MTVQQDHRPSPIAGRWYPSQPEKLASSVDGYIKAAGTAKLEGEVIAVIVPHAGHLYSGPVAGYAFSTLAGMDKELAVVISPMHHSTREALLTCGHAAYSTPLGPVPIDSEGISLLNKKLEDRLGFGLSFVREDQEHSLEIELPFLQRTLTEGFKLLPVMMRSQTARVARHLGEAVAETVAGRRVILTASSDLSHFFPQHIANQLDQEILKKIEAFDPQGVLDVEAEGKGYACGKGAVAAVLWAAEKLGADRVKILNYATSGDITGDYDQVVGYAAAVCTRTHKPSI
jgi:MEMO1 family protein